MPMTDPGIILKDPSLGKRKLWLTLTREKYRQEEGLFLAEGFKVVRELFRSAWTTESLLILESRANHYREFLAALPPKTPVYALPEGDWRRLTQDKNSEGIIAVVADRPREARDLDREGGRGHLLLFHRINNPNNLGAIMRTAHWFGFKKLIIGAGSVDYTNPKVVRTSMGSIFHLDISAGVEISACLARLKKDCLLVATVPQGGLNPRPCQRRTALILGSETHGLPEEILTLADLSWTVPGGGGAESLSLPQAAAIAMYECVGRGESPGGEGP
ncbi:MAG: RNA methyltransferase [Smithellaceae bacterium]|nr:RNA methyltransferase [Smithellaceae bacterium]